MSFSLAWLVAANYPPGSKERIESEKISKEHDERIRIEEENERNAKKYSETSQKKEIQQSPVKPKGNPILEQIENRTVEQKGNPTTYLSQLSSLLFQDLHSDVAFQFEGNQDIPAHKNVLSVRCRYFHNMFTSGMKESKENKIPITGWDYEVFKALLEFIYSNKVNLNESLALRLMKVSDMYQIPELTDICVKFLTAELTLLNVFGILDEAEKLQITTMKDAVINFLASKFLEFEDEHFEKLSKEHLVEVIKFISKTVKYKGKA